MNRWIIEIPKRKISSTNFNNHFDDIEMSGEMCSGVIKYGTFNNIVDIKRRIIYPLFRYQPNVTQSSYQLDIDDNLIGLKEQFIKVELDGVLTLKSKTDNFNITHLIYPSTTLPIFYEQIILENTTNIKQEIKYDKYKKIATKLCCKGYCHVEISCDKDIKYIYPNTIETLTFSFSCRYDNDVIPNELDSLNKRRKRVSELLEECDFTCGNDIIDTMFAFSKIRAGESIFKTKNGRIHCPGGTNYYAAIWCNDQIEYANPWFGYCDDEILIEASENAIKWLKPYMNEELLPIPSSIICEGDDYWNGANDRGDASMFLFGTSRYMLERGISLDSSIGKQLDWSYEYVKSKFNNDNVVISDSDELEGRISSGINLNTSSLSYGGLMYYQELLKKNNNISKANEVLSYASKLRLGIESYFGGNVKGYNTYHYHKGCNDIRSWNALPLYMGINERKDDTINSILDKLWKDGSVLTTENENIMWDRSALYFIMSMFRCDYNSKAFEKLLELSTKRLLGDRVPYCVEAYPEANMRHLSAESALYCRVIVDGLINIDYINSLSINPHIPSSIKEFSMKNIILEGKKANIYYNDNNVTIEYIK